MRCHYHFQPSVFGFGRPILSSLNLCNRTLALGVIYRSVGPSLERWYENECVLISQIWTWYRAAGMSCSLGNDRRITRISSLDGMSSWGFEQGHESSVGGCGEGSCRCGLDYVHADGSNEKGYHGRAARTAEHASWRRQPLGLHE